MAEMLESAGAENRDQTLLRLAERAQLPSFPSINGDDVEGIPYVIVDGKVVDLEKLLPRPARIRERAVLHTCQSFLDYVAEHRGDMEAVVFFDASQHLFTAILDYHDGDPRWCQHRAMYQLPTTEEWKTWAHHNRKSMSQADFAEFIENNLPDIRVPDGATLLDMVKTMQAKKAVQFESAVRLDNGQVEFVYVEDIRGTATKGKVDVPAEFTIGIPPFRGEAPFAIVARLRYRIGDDKRLVLWYDLVRPHKVVEAVSAEIAARIKAESGALMLYGVAP